MTHTKELCRYWSRRAEECVVLTGIRKEVEKRKCSLKVNVQVEELTHVTMESAMSWCEFQQKGRRKLASQLSEGGTIRVRERRRMFFCETHSHTHWCVRHTHTLVWYVSKLYLSINFVDEEIVLYLKTSFLLSCLQLLVYTSKVLCS